MSPSPRRRFGQHFLHDPWSINHILAAVDPVPGQQLVEIGPGRGAITTGLLRVARCLDVVELDRDLLEPLAQSCANLGTLRIHSADALKFNFCALLGAENTGLPDSTGQMPARLRVVGNLPYNISTPLLFHLLAQAACIDDLHLLLQKEVVARLAAAPGSKTYGRLSVMAQIHCSVQWLFDVPPTAFKPPPKVTSSFVRIKPYREPKYAIADPALFAKLVAQAFSQRRKTLRNTLRPLLSEAAIKICGLDSTLRPEQLAITDFVHLANTLANLQSDQKS